MRLLIHHIIGVAILLICQACEPHNPPPAPPLVAPFSVAPDQQVVFAHGNLQHHPLSNTYRFAAQQTDYIGATNKNFSSTYDGWVDLFTWGNTLPTNNTHHDPTTFHDWGTLSIAEDTLHTWRTLTSNEWQYLCYARPQADQLIAVASIEGINGLLLFPDQWTAPEGIDLKLGFATHSGQQAYAQWQTLTSKQWNQLQKTGAVFLPAVGLRIDSGVYMLQFDGYYWTASPYNDHYALCLNFEANQLTIDANSRHYGMAVRLVRDY